MLDDADRGRIGDRRGDHNRLGFVLQVATFRYLGRLLEDPLDVRWRKTMTLVLAGAIGLLHPSAPAAASATQVPPVAHPRG